MSRIKAKGKVEIFVKDARSGEILQHIIDHNLVVTLGRSNVAKLIGGHVDGKAVTKISFGEGTVAPALSDTTITNPFVKAIDSVTYPQPNQVRFAFSMAAGEGTGMNITEVGLLNTSNALFARKTRSAIAKTADVVISGTWTITIN